LSLLNFYLPACINIRGNKVLLIYIAEFDTIFGGVVRRHTLAMDMQEILSQVITSTNEIFRAEAGSVALLEAEGQRLVIRAAVGAGADAVRGLSVPLDKGIIGWVISNEEPALVPDVRQDPRFYKAVDETSGFETRSILCVPMQTDGRTIGVIELMNMDPVYLSDNGLKTLSVIADHAALAIENARLLAETRQWAEEQALLFNAMTFVTSDLALETVLDAVSRQMVEALRADLCLISHWNREKDELRPMQSYGGPGVKRPDRMIRRVSNYPHYQLVLEAHVPGLLKSEAGSLSSQELAWLKMLTVSELWLLPLIYRRQTVGLVEIGRMQAAGPMTPRELRLAEMMAAQAAVSIEHASLYNEATRGLAEAQVLQEVMVAAASSLDFDQVLSGTIKALHRTLGIERLGFFLPAADGEMVVPHPATIGFSFSNENFHYPVEGSAVGWVIRHGRPLLLPTSQEVNRYYKLAPDTQARVCVPVLLDDKVVAVLNAESPRPGAFQEEDLRLFKAIAAELAVALENARLFQESRAAEANYHDLFDNANDLIVTIDSNLRISSVNKMATTTSGYTLAELCGVLVTRFVTPKDRPRLYRLLKDLLFSNQSPSFELTILSKNQQEILLEASLRVQRQGTRPVGLQCIARDITHRRRLEQQLQQTEKLSAIGKLVAGVAHELNNPLTAIIGYADLLLNSDTLPEFSQSDLEVISRQAQRARLIVRNLLTFARSVHPEPEPVNVNEIIQASLVSMKPNLQAHSLRVITRLDENLPAILADAHQLEQVFINLITNAIQVLATVEGERHLTIESRWERDRILLSFVDNGPGIPEHLISQIFDPFFSTKTVGEGTGLGLSICFGIISEHQGRIWAKNAPEGGAIFYIDLPVKASKPVPPAAVMARPYPVAWAKPLRVLVVDDEPALLTLLDRILKRSGHTVETAPDGTTALIQLKAQSYDLVICDVLMPDILGPDLYRQITEEFPALTERFIFITGNAVDLNTRSFLEESGVPWLSKPFLPADIEKIVEQTVNGK
jgi:two-component system NtrC family sensor kinase